ncbi:MAG TPA: MFS transporter [Roseiflexaceae bacterium]
MPARGFDAWLLGICAARFLINLIFMTYAAALLVLKIAWGMSSTQAGSIPMGFQLGLSLSLLLFSWLADLVGARRIFLISAGLGAVMTLTFAAFARSYVSGLVLNTLVAFGLGGTYTASIILVADRYLPARRGAAMGWLLASSSISYAASLLLSGAMLTRGGYPSAFPVTAAGAPAGLAVGWLVLRSTPNVVHPRHEGVHTASEVLRNPDAARLIVGYTAHSWELLGMWAWAPAFVAASLAMSGSKTLAAVQSGAYLAAVFHVMGLLASTTMGHLSDRLGRRTVLLALAAASAVCSLVFGWLIALPTVLVVAVGAAYSFAALGDSPVLSVALTEVVRPAFLGSALAIRSLLGFGAGALAPPAFGAILDATILRGRRPLSGVGPL